MNALEARLVYPFGETLPAPAQRIEVAPDVFWIRMPLPFALDHINLWLLRDRFDGKDGWTVIDCGIADQTIRSLWDAVIGHQLDGLPVRRVLCTHTHPDHLGNAAWLTERFDVPLWMTQGEYLTGCVLNAGLAGADSKSVAAHFHRNGAEAGIVDALRGQDLLHFAALVPDVPRSFRRIVDGERISIGTRHWEVIIGRGHSPEHAALYSREDGLLISGDMVLPRISTNVSVYAIEPLANPVRWFLDSLRRFETCDPEVTRVLPSHGRPFQRLGERVLQLTAHHEARLADLLEACRAEPLSGATAVPAVFGRRSFDTHQMTFAIGEALAHLHALWFDGLVERTVGNDAIARFAAVR